MEIIIVVFSIIIAFLFGSIPTGYILVKHFKGIDIRTIGSGNIGSTNVKRIAGTKVSIATQVGDILKGVIPVALALITYKSLNINIDRNMFCSIAALAAILGHNYTPFLGFNGGKGVNTTLGAFVLLAPAAVFSGVAVYFLLRFFTKIVSIRSICLGLTMPVICLIIGLPMPIVISTAISTLFMIYRHKENLKRLINHEEK